MSRRCPGEHEPTPYDYKPPFPLKWLALCGKLTLVSILLGPAAIGILLLAFGPENVPHLALGVILALMLVPPRVFLFMLAHLVFHFSWFGLPRPRRIEHPTPTDHWIEANALRQRWLLRVASLVFESILFACIALCSPELKNAKGPWIDFLLFLLVGPLLLLVLLGWLWRPIRPKGVCGECGTWFMQDDMDRVALTGRCPACDIPNPIESPADGDSGTSD